MGAAHRKPLIAGAVAGAAAAGITIPSPLQDWDALASLGARLLQGETGWDVVAGASTRTGVEARARISHGITDAISVGAEAFARTTGTRGGLSPGWDVGVLAGISGRF